ncbi:putative beta-galactosidase E [Aspergillus steynii IBT 23096]|uniref:Beta-galactosidase n=1 Tax=Aspergillus steynii IBT 23096 TaxID=1392250 RepID=A0A2I2GK68_9EURO|nr:putative beta-galactosidase E [Aspergillus steynii IBT 23096]PLB53273.1 putative beta-galactosidase E [Aspergillus steynii IBT 23096]
MLMSGEFHPFRLPVPGLWLDIFQKIKSLGFNGVSFYTDWGLLEANPGHVVTDGIWSLDEFFAAAAEAGIYLIARPGPYINAETSAGGIPGWVLKIKGVIRSNSEDYLSATDEYMRVMGEAIAKAQITNGGPVVMVQPENEYTTWPGVDKAVFPEEMHKEVMEYAGKQLREAGVVVPSVVNDNENKGYFAPGSGKGETDLYGIDAYPMRYDCGNPYVWPTYRFPRDWQLTHRNHSPETPFAIMEFQGGSGGGWEGVNEDQCAILVNNEAVRVVNKNNYGFGVKIFNIYMTYGGTNWGNLGYHGGYTSYDYGAAIAEDRTIWREKYSEEKLQANFLKVSPAYLTATPGVGKNGSYTDNDNIAVTPILSEDGHKGKVSTNFYLVRHAGFTLTGKAEYRLQVQTSIGDVTIPQLGGKLLLDGRDSKIHVTDYDVGGVNLVYSTAEVFTWAKAAGGKRVLLVYGGEGEVHEIALSRKVSKPTILEGKGVKIQKKNAWVIHWEVTPARRIVKAGNLEIHLLWRNDAYQHWVLELPVAKPIENYSSPSKDTVIVRGGYLLRSASIAGKNLILTGDVNATTPLEVISAPMSHLNSITFNGERLKTSKFKTGRLTASVTYNPPSISLPTLSDLEWKYLDSLPEIHPEYTDEKWTSLDHRETNNTLKPDTPTCLYADDYGYHGGSLIYRGHFDANGAESSVFLNVSGGVGFGHSVWLNQTFLGSWTGRGSNKTFSQTLPLANLTAKKPYVLTVLIDHMGQDEEAPGTDAIKFPRGILDYNLSGHPKSDITWKMTGNLGGEQYRDLVRGPMNEGAMFAERQGYHFPKPPSGKWEASSPFSDGITKAGVGFYSTSFSLDLPKGYDVPMNFVFNASSSTSVSARNSGHNYRCQLFVNGYQFGKYVNNLGPQTHFPVPEGILNYNGVNYVSVTLWALDSEGARLGGLDLVASKAILSGYRKPKAAPQPVWGERDGVY